VVNVYEEFFWVDDENERAELLEFFRECWFHSRHAPAEEAIDLG
jgi:hypothetical protein